jgi:hypothetical protein
MTHLVARRPAAPSNDVTAVPLWSLLTATVGAIVIAQAARPLDDPDVWWHVRSGDQILSQHRMPSRETWVYPALGRRWVPTSWLSDVVLSLAHSAGGWQGVRVLTILVAATFAFLLARRLRQEASPLGAAIAYAAVSIACIGYLRERPQAVSLVLLVLLAGWADRTRRGSPPSLLVVIPITWCWASLHGMWILVPPVLLMAGACGGRSTFRRSLAPSLLSLVSAALTPVGPRLVGQPFVVAHRAREIAEWAPVHVWSFQALVIAGLAVVLVAGRRWLMPGERFFVATLLVFATLAVRNVAPAAVLLSLPLSRVVTGLVPTSMAHAPGIVRRATAITGPLAAVAILATTPAISSTIPTRLMSELNRHPGAHVLVDYNIGGLVTGTARRVSPAVDGRTDVYDPAWLHRYLLLTEARGDWRPVLRTLSPDLAVVQQDGALARALQTDGWRQDAAEAGWVLLSPPGD